MQSTDNQIFLADSQLDRFKKDLLVRINNKYKKISKNEIDFISADGKYANIHVGDRVYTVRKSLKAMSDMMPISFIRVHASYIANTSRVESINTHRSEISFESEQSIPYSRKYKAVLFDLFSIV